MVRRHARKALSMSTTQPSASAASASSSAATPIQTSGIDPSTLESFRSFFAFQDGVWNSERTYHYMQPKANGEKRENSQTSFGVLRLDNATKQKVLDLKGKDKSISQINDSCEGFEVSFYTYMASRPNELIMNKTNMLFVPNPALSQGSIIRGDYIRDSGYEDKSPAFAIFEFDAAKMELLMKTKYTQVVSVDTITLVNPLMRLRRILNFQRPLGDFELNRDTVLDQVVLAGFGVETKSLDHTTLVPMPKI